MRKFELGWYESHYMEVEANSVEEAEEMFHNLAAARQRSVATYTGIIDDLRIWETKPDIEVSDDMMSTSTIYGFDCVVLDEKNEDDNDE